MRIVPFQGFVGRRRYAAARGFVHQLIRKLRSRPHGAPVPLSLSDALPGKDAPYRGQVRRECCWTAVAREIATSHPLGPPPHGAAPGGLSS